MPHFLSQRITNPSLPGRLGNYAAPGGNPATVLELYLRTLLTVALGFGGLYFFFHLIRSGYEYITAGGDKEALQKATARIRSALIGVVILFSIFAIIFVVETLFGISIIRFNIPVIQ
jgi:hypothetical protein